ncbi:histidine phosphatase family protein [Candidatus Solincola tengchongensis]|uniref:histidine phosphatase family protein n=1 Tax=Candidatus Solincola tengchongensis TaxID=2900693 RepID=UPI00257DDEC2|nr:histidine phosphatase family protein [Candidatus Solincola tengchongensis]
MGTAYLLRHGETEYHAQHRLLGRLDIGLNERGREQARRVVEFFRGLKLDAVYSSPLRRCLETAAPVAEDHGLSIQVLEGLMEVDMGEWDGRTFDELFREEGEMVGKWMRNPSSVAIPGGEDFGTVRDRVMSAVREITSRHPGDQRVLVVTHGGPIRGILCEALGMELDGMFRIQIDLASISAVKYFDGGIPETAMVTLVNETYHLR